MRYLPLLLLLCIASAEGRALYEAIAEDGVVVTLYDEPCKLDAVTNLKNRATWTEKGKVTEGCFGVRGEGLVLIYFADKTVGVAPAGAFKPVNEMGV